MGGGVGARFWAAELLFHRLALFELCSRLVILFKRLSNSCAVCLLLALLLLGRALFYIIILLSEFRVTN